MLLVVNCAHSSIWKTYRLRRKDCSRISHAFLLFHSWMCRVSICGPRTLVEPQKSPPRDDCCQESKQTKRNQKHLRDSHYSERHMVRITRAPEGWSGHSVLCSVGHWSPSLEQCHTQGLSHRNILRDWKCWSNIPQQPGIRQSGAFHGTCLGSWY